MIKTNCELPLCMLNMNDELNDYDFILLHLYASNKHYKNYYDTKEKRMSILDCSAYEYYIRGQSVNFNKYKNAIKSINPTFYILPDTLMNKEKTLEDSIAFINIMERGEGLPQPIGVLQGNSLEDFVECLDVYKKNDIKDIAIPFHNSFYLEWGKRICEDEKTQPNTDILYSIGRIYIMEQLEKYLVDFDHIHALGTHWPSEKVSYPSYIQTCDTAYPVKNGYKHKSIFEPKEDILIDDIIDIDIDEITRSVIINNINAYRGL